MHMLCGCRVSDKVPVSRSQSTMTEPNHTVAVQGAAPDRTVFGPALWSNKTALKGAFRDPPVMSKHRQIYVDQRVGRRESLPVRRDATKAVNDPMWCPADTTAASLALRASWPTLTCRRRHFQTPQLSSYEGVRCHDNSHKALTICTQPDLPHCYIPVSKCVLTDGRAPRHVIRIHPASRIASSSRSA